MIKLLKGLPQYLREAREEMKKVVWPSRSQAVHHTILVIGISIAVGVFIGMADIIFSFLLETVV